MCEKGAPINTEKKEPEVSFEHFKKFHTVALRILLIDDKVGAKEKTGDLDCANTSYVTLDNIQKNGLWIKRCNDKFQCEKNQCKLCTIKRLMDNGKNGENGETNNEDGKSSIFSGIGADQDYYYWEENGIECYYCTTVIEDFIDDDNIDFLKYNEIVLKDRSSQEDFDIAKLTKSVSQWFSSKERPFEIQCNFMESQNINDKPRKEIDKVQIIGVKDVRTALLLLSRYKFDMLFIDYLLDYKRNEEKRRGEGEREYSIQFFKFLSKKYDKEAENEKNDAKKKKYRLLERLRRAILNNRGPLDKLWIMPITGFNSPFIQNLQNNHVPLISTRWHIENGADPITTPWQFLVKLNQIIELQLKGCVYEKEQLITFLTFTGADLERRFPRNRKDNKPTCRFHDFQAFMGAEFSNFISHFGARPIIKRDAMIDEGDHHDKSVFSTYIWNEFYREKTNVSKNEKKKSLFALHNLMQIFYQAAASMPEDRNGVMRLREAFRRLRYYIEINGVDEEKEKKDDEEKKKDDEEKKKKLEETMAFIADSIDVLLEEGEKI